MKHASDQLQPLSHPYDTCYQPEPARITDEMEHLELLMPELSHTAARNLQTYALAYVEHYQANLLQLEHEWQFLYAALRQAWQREEYAIVVRLVSALAHPAGRISNPSVSEHILYLGIEASRRTQDREHFARFLNRLGGLLFTHGKYREGRRTWRRSLGLAGNSGSSLVLWEPLSSFAHIADILGCYTTVKQFVETLLHTDQNDDPDSLAVALFIRGFYARWIGDLERAYEDQSCCLRLLSYLAPGGLSSPYHQLFIQVVQTELARVQEHYTRSQEYTETALSLAQIFGDRYTVVALLIDQLRYTNQQGQSADTRAAFLRLRDVSFKSEEPHLYQRCRFFEQLLAEHLPKSPSSQEQQALSTELQEPLSKREGEVLHLVAVGLTNQEVARRLVITRGTVKKHLEHVYTKLDVHGRTSAIAKARTLKILP